MSTTGLSPAANDSIVLNGWLGRYIQKGELGGVYPDIKYTMEGDSPSLLYFIPNGLGHIERPEWGSWGGRYSPLSDDPHETQFGDTLDTVYYTSGNKTETEKSNHATIFRWRSAFQTDFVARMQWSFSPNYTSARHPPVIRVNGNEGLEPLVIHARLNQFFIFDAGETIDTDQHDDLQFEWYQYQEPSYLPNPSPQSDEKLNIQPLPEGQRVKLNKQGFKDAVRAKKVRVTLPATRDAEMVDGYHLILQVSTGGEVPITRYKRVVLVV